MWWWIGISAKEDYFAYVWDQAKVNLSGHKSSLWYSELGDMVRTGRVPAVNWNRPAAKLSICFIVLTPLGGSCRITRDNLLTFSSPSASAT